MIEFIFTGVVLLILLAIISAPFRGGQGHHIDHHEYCACPDCVRVFGRIHRSK